MFCDGSHWRKPWTPKRVGNRLHFTAAEEAAYPLLLCQRLIDALFELCFPQMQLVNASGQRVDSALKLSQKGRKNEKGTSFIFSRAKSQFSLSPKILESFLGGMIQCSALRFKQLLSACCMRVMVFPFYACNIATRLVIEI